MFLDHTQRRSTVGRTPLDEWTDRRRDLYLTTHDTHNRQISMPPVGFEPKISAGERPCRSPAEKHQECWETSRMGAPYIYDISCLRVNSAFKGLKLLKKKPRERAFKQFKRPRPQCVKVRTPSLLMAFSFGTNKMCYLMSFSQNAINSHFTIFILSPCMLLSYII